MLNLTANSVSGPSSLYFVRPPGIQALPLPVTSIIIIMHLVYKITILCTWCNCTVLAWVGWVSLVGHSRKTGVFIVTLFSFASQVLNAHPFVMTHDPAYIHIKNLVFYGWSEKSLMSPALEKIVLTILLPNYHLKYKIPFVYVLTWCAHCIGDTKSGQ